MKKFFTTLHKNLYIHRWKTVLSVAGLLIVGLSVPEATHAFSLAEILFYLNAFAYFMLVYVPGILASNFTELLLWVAGFSGFTNRPVIIEAWTVVRDIANMFFIVILLVIAFGTLFRIEAYSWKKLLPKMIIAAILVNYSRAIVGVAVDASQVIMLTFVEAIRPAAQAGFVQAFQFDALLTRDTKIAQAAAGDNASSIEAKRLLAIVVAGFMLITVVSVLGVYMVVLIGRLVFVWFLTVLSPLAFTCMVLPATEKYYKQWTEMLTRYIVVGPMVLFFLWLSLFISSKSAGDLSATAGGIETDDIGVTTDIAVTKALSDGTVIANFIIAVMMMMAGLKIAQDSSSEMGSIVSKASNVGSTIRKGYVGAVAGTAAFAGRSAIDALQTTTGVDLNLKRQWGLLQQQRERRKQLRFAKGYSKASERAKDGKLVGGMLGAAGYTYDQYAPIGGQQGFTKAMKRRFFINGGYNANKRTTDRMNENAETRAELSAKIGEQEDEVKKNNITFEEKAKQTAALDEAAAKNADAREYADQGLISAEKGSAGREVIEAYRKDLDKKRSETKDADEYAELSAQISALDGALETGGELDLSGNADMKAGMVEMLDKQREKIDGERSDLDSKDAVDAKTYQERLDAAGAAERADRDDLDEEDKKLMGRISKWAKTADMEALRQQKTLESEVFSGMESDQEEALITNLRQRVENGDIAGAMEMMKYMAKVGHSNEVPNAFQGMITDDDGNPVTLAANADDMRKIYEYLVNKKGANDQMVLSAMERFSSIAQGVGHWWGAQMVGNRGGQFYFRNQDQIQQSLRNEGDKFSANSLARGNNRLGIGHYRADENGNVQYELNPAMASIIAKNFNKFEDLIKKNLYNTNQAEHLAIAEPQFRALINAMHTGKDRDKAHANLDSLLSITKSQRGQNYQDAVTHDIKTATKALEEAAKELKRAA